MDRSKYNISQHFNETYNFIENSINNNQAILVHCAQGISRSGTIVIVYLMKKYNKTYEEALKQVQKKRSIVEPNKGFEKQLKEFEELNLLKLL